MKCQKCGQNKADAFLRVMVNQNAVERSEWGEPLAGEIRHLRPVVRGSVGERASVGGGLFQVSNRPMGWAGGEGIDRKKEEGLAVVAQGERETREGLLSRDTVRAEDSVWRAWGVLTHARCIESKEALLLLSRVRLGCSLGWFAPEMLGTLNQLAFLVRAGALQLYCGEEMHSDKRDESRAAWAREMLH